MAFYTFLRLCRATINYLKDNHPEIPKNELVFSRKPNWTASIFLPRYWKEFEIMIKRYLIDALSNETIKVKCDPADFFLFCNERYGDTYEQGIYDFIHYHDDIVKLYINSEEKYYFYEFELYKRDPIEWVKFLENDDHAQVVLPKHIDLSDIIPIISFDPGFFNLRNLDHFEVKSISCASSCLVILKQARNQQLKEYALQILVDSLNVMENIERLNHIEKLEQSQKARQKGKRANVFRVDALQNLQKQCGGPGVKSVSERKKCFRKWANDNNTNNDNNILIPVFIWDLLVPFFDSINILTKEVFFTNCSPCKEDEAVNNLLSYDLDNLEFNNFFEQNEKLLLQGGKKHRQFENVYDFKQRLPDLIETYKEIKKRGLW